MKKSLPTLYKLSGLSKLIMLNRYSTFLRVFATEKKYHWVCPLVLKSVARTRLYSYSDLSISYSTSGLLCEDCRIRIETQRPGRYLLLFLGCSREVHRVDELMATPILCMGRDLCCRRRLYGCNFMRRRWTQPLFVRTTIKCCALEDELFRRHH
jgi:hypothetical protein